MRRPGDWARQQSNAVRWRFFKRTFFIDPKGFVLPVLLILAASAFILFESARINIELVGGALAGALVGGAAVWFLGLLGAHSGATNKRVGADAEEFTAQELQKLKKHVCIHGLEFDGRDVDHTLIGPSGVFALETKWTSVPLSLDVADERTAKFLDRAWWAAGRIRALVRLAGEVEVDVRPALVLWGPGIPDLATGHSQINGVQVLIGRSADQWRALFEAAKLDSSVVLAASNVVEEFQRQQLESSTVGGGPR